MSMKCTGTILLALLSVVLSFSLLPAGDGNPEGPSSKVKIALMEVENKSGPNLGSEWDFLKQEKGPSSDPLSNGLRKRLAEVLAQTERFAVIDQLALERKTEVVATKKPAMQERREETLPPLDRLIREAEELPRSVRHLNRGPHFFVYCSATLHEDLVTIEVRLLDPRTMKLIKATAIEGRPEDLSRFRPVPSGEESPTEKAVQVAIIKAVKWIEANSPRGPEWIPTVMVRASTANIKEGPSIQSATLIIVRQGTTLEKVGEERSWVKVKLENGEVGWIYGDQVE